MGNFSHVFFLWNYKLDFGRLWLYTGKLLLSSENEGFMSTTITENIILDHIRAEEYNVSTDSSYYERIYDISIKIF